ncbi:13521_t:CDS:2, partial [Funneliformis geosporum]
SWKLTKNRNNYFNDLKTLKQTKNEETLQLTQINSQETVRLAEMKSENLQEHTAIVIGLHKYIGNELTTFDFKGKKIVSDKGIEQEKQDVKLTSVDVAAMQQNDEFCKHIFVIIAISFLKGTELLTFSDISWFILVDSGSINRNIESNIDLNTSESTLEIENKDVKEDNDDEYEEYPEEIISVEILKNLAIERLLSIKNGIARYKIIFLPEEHLYNPIKCLFTDQEWIVMESNWRKIEEKIECLLPVFERNLQLLLERYDNAISQNVIGYYIDLNKVESIISQTPFENNPPYLFARDWMLRWIQQLDVFPDTRKPFNRCQCIRTCIPQSNYKQTLGGNFLDLNGMIRMNIGEIENTDRKNQLELKRCLDKRKTNSGSWFHDAVLLMNVNHTEIQVAFGEVGGNAYYHDDVKMRGDRAKILKAMQLALFNIRKLFPENDSNLEKLETYGILVY